MFDSKGFFTAEQEAQLSRDYTAELVRRFEAGLPLSRLDKREARRAIKARDAFAAQRKHLAPQEP